MQEELYSRPCEQCGEAVTNARARFCSNVCANRWTAAHRKPMTLKPCRACGERKRKASYHGRPDLPRGLCETCYRNRLKNPTYGQRRPSKMDNGYMRRWHPEHPLADGQGLVYVHREVWFDANGPIPEGHHIHHRNGDRTDNRLENLEVIEGGEHARQHAIERGYVVNQYGVWPVRAR